MILVFQNIRKILVNLNLRQSKPRVFDKYKYILYNFNVNDKI